eukprot:scaffold296914_cov33-Tisochrysis_lutea.AAC.5
MISPSTLQTDASDSPAIIRPPGMWPVDLQSATAVAHITDASSRGSSSERDSTASQRQKREEQYDKMQVLRYIQIIDAGRKLVACRTDGYVLSKVRTDRRAKGHG